MLNHLQTQRQLLFDLAANYLEHLPSGFARIAYISGLRNPSTGSYVHDQLAATYTAQQVDEVLAKCHEELFERILETPLSTQERDLREHVASLPGVFAENVREQKKVGEQWIPPEAPSYLKELYRSNLNVLTEILLDNSKVR